MFPPEAGGPQRVATAFFLHSMIMPAITPASLHFWRINAEWPQMSVQFSLPGSGSVWGMIATLAWIPLLTLGILAMFTIRRFREFRWMVGLTLLGQLLLRTVYGEETFLYGLHVVPLLILTAALSTLTAMRRPALILTGLLTLTGAVNNGLQFKDAMAFFQQHGPQRHQVERQMRLRPADPWPRSNGHVVLATPGSRDTEKAYHEPGGSFSPTAGSFGVSIWVADQAGHAIVTSDQLSLDQIRQQFAWNEGSEIPGIVTDTPYYQTHWSLDTHGRWTLGLTPSGRDHRLMIVLRSVGPAGGPIRSIEWDNRRLLLNERWSVTVQPAPVLVSIGEEGAQIWMTERAQRLQWHGSDGWGYARIEPGEGHEVRLSIDDSFILPSRVRLPPKGPDTLALDLPDHRFRDSFRAQIAHLMMGLVGTEARPGDPIQYPMSSVRAGAHIIVALRVPGRSRRPSSCPFSLRNTISSARLGRKPMRPVGDLGDGRSLVTLAGAGVC